MGYAVAGSGLPMANTASLVFSSASSSMGMSMLSGQNMMSLNLGLGTMNFATGKFHWDFAGDKPLDCLSDAFNALSVANDVTALATVDYKKTAAAEEQLKQEAQSEQQCEEAEGVPLEPPGQNVPIEMNSIWGSPEQVGENWDKMGQGTGFYTDAGDNAADMGFNEGYVGDDLFPGGQEEENGSPEFRIGRGHVGVFDKMVNGVKVPYSAVHFDMFDINKNWLYHLLETNVEATRPYWAR